MYKIITTCIEGATVLWANIMCVTHENKNCALLFIIDELISGSSLLRVMLFSEATNFEL